MAENGRRMAANDRAARTLKKWGRPIEVSPAQALLGMVHEAAGNVAYLGGLIDEMVEKTEEQSQQQLHAGLRQQEDGGTSPEGEDSGDGPGGVFGRDTVRVPEGGRALFAPIVGISSAGYQFVQSEDQRAVVRLYGEWTDRLVKYSKAAIDAGIARAQVELARRQAEIIISLFKTVIGSLALDAAQTKQVNLLLANEMRRLAETKTVHGVSRSVELLEGPIRKTHANAASMRKKG